MGFMQILGLILVGIVIGVLARLILPGRQRIGMLFTIALGIAGAVIGGMIASQIGAGSVNELNVFGFVRAVISAVLLVAVADRLGLPLVSWDGEHLERASARIPVYTPADAP